MDFNAAYWICVVDALGFGSQKILDILRSYKNAQNFLADKVNLWKFSGFLSSKNIEKLKRADLNKAQKVLERCKTLGYEVITIENPKYPKKLRNITNPPAVLYVKGALPELNDRLCISIVGTRSSSAYGNRIAFEMGYNLAKAGAVVVSGGAIGIDCLSQKGALQARGKPVTVLGAGLNVHYLSANRNLCENVARSGALISEYPPDFHSARWTFPMRNRVISGLADGVLVIEAAQKSGSLITANLALEQNRDVFAIPGNINSRVSSGTNKLIKICAKPVMSVKDILEDYYHLYPYLSKNVAAVEENSSAQLKINESRGERVEPSVTMVPEGISSRAKVLFEAMTSTPTGVDDLSETAKLTTAEALQAITELELNGLIKSHAGKRYSK